MAESPNPTPIEGARIRTWQNAGAPTSGTAGTLAGIIQPGAFLWDTTNGVLFVNEGTSLSPYYTPAGYDQPALFGVNSDWRDGAGAPIAGTPLTIAGSGVRVYGLGMEISDSGAVVQTAGDGGQNMRIIATNEIGKLVAIGMDAGVMQPDQRQLMVIDAEVTNVSAITARAMFLGFLGVAGATLPPAVTGATTVATLVQDDLAGLWFDSGLTDVDRIFGVHNKADADATQDLTADGDTGVDIAAAATFQRLRVEINAAGDMLAFIDKVQVYAKALASAPTVALSPVLYLESQATATKSADVRRFATWAYR